MQVCPPSALECAIGHRPVMADGWETETSGCILHAPPVMAMLVCASAVEPTVVHWMELVVCRLRGVAVPIVPRPTDRRVGLVDCLSYRMVLLSWCSRFHHRAAHRRCPILDCRVMSPHR